ncbi:MAG: transposon Pol polyprotein, partial [Alphaproteobacteria bacterium]|nr:transposon Pol polyprotein [Alphaproteobacteria bacterium]
HMQDKSIYTPDQVSSPTVSISSFFTIAAIAASERRHIMTFDIGQAYLSADMPGEVLMTLDPLVTEVLCKIDEQQFGQYRNQTDGTMIVKLSKALYGCVESAKLWYEHLKKILINLGYTVSPADICVFNRESESGNQSTVSTHVDDGFASCQDKNDLLLLEKELKAEFKTVNINHGEVHEYLGMKLDFRNKFICELTMEAYIKRLVEENLIKITSKTPAGSDLFTIDTDSPALSKKDSELFHKVTCQLLFLGTRVRPDILLPVSFLCSRVQSPTVQDVNKVTRVLCYLSGTLSLGLRTGGDESGDLRLMCYADAAFAVHPDSMKSHSGILISVGRGVVLVKSIKQKIVTKSSAEAELVALSDGTSLTAHEIEFLRGQDTDLQGELFQDNKSTINLAQNGRSSSDRTRHVKIRYFFVKQYLDSHEVRITYCPTLSMVADILTKPLQGDHFTRLRDILLGYRLE